MKIPRSLGLIAVMALLVSSCEYLEGRDNDIPFDPAFNTSDLSTSFKKFVAGDGYRITCTVQGRDTERGTSHQVPFYISVEDGRQWITLGSSFGLHEPNENGFDYPRRNYKLNSWRYMGPNDYLEINAEGPDQTDIQFVLGRALGPKDSMGYVYESSTISVDNGPTTRSWTASGCSSWTEIIKGEEPPFVDLLN